MTEAARHVPVLSAEVVSQLAAKPGRHFIDGTFGAGGHALQLLAATAPDGRVLAIDLDAKVVAAARHALPSDATSQNRLILVHGNFKNLEEIARNHGFRATGGCLLDLGVSSMQLDDPTSGFNFQSDRLDGRFDQSVNGPTAADLVNTSSAAELVRILAAYGEEPLARPIAAAIVRQREMQPITNATELAAIAASVYRRKYHRASRRHPATRVFQALRIAVNDELENLRAALDGALRVTPMGARIGVISYHSLEDRIVKHFFRDQQRGCRCAPDAPVCQCGGEPILRVVTRRPILPTAAEVAKNPRSRSAKLRVAEKISSASKSQTDTK